MKTAKSLLAPYVPSLADPAMIFHEVLNQGLPSRIPPTKACDIRCPMCGLDKGYPIRHSKTSVWWACANSDCIQKNTLPLPKKATAKLSLREVLERSNVPPIHLNASYDHWCHGQDVRKSLEDWLATNQGVCVLFGQKGCGKSFMSACAIGSKSHRNGATSLFYDMTEAKFEWTQETASTGLKTLEPKFRNCDLLVMDDIDKIIISDGFYQFLYRIINYRYQPGKQTIITSNLSLEEMESFLGSAISSRVFNSSCLCLDINGEDLRNNQVF